MWSRHEIGLEGTYSKYFPFSPMIERPQIAPYHNKKFVVRRAPSATLGKNGDDG